MITRNRILILAIAISMLSYGTTHAQSRNKIQNFGTNRVQNAIDLNSASRYTAQNYINSVLNNSVTVDRNLSRVVAPSRPPIVGSTQKPFSSISRRPTVSPYLALNNSLNPVSDYYNIVRPQQNQRRFNQQMQRQTNANQQRLNQMAAQGPYNRAGNDTRAPTGHAAGFMNLGSYLQYGGYYPAPARR